MNSIYGTICLVVSVLCITHLAVAEDADAKLENFFKQYLTERFQMQPLEATDLGDHRFDNLLDDVSKTARDRWLTHTRQTLDELPRQIDYSALSRNGQIDFDIFKHHLEASQWRAENRHPFEEDPRTYVAYLNDSIYQLLTRSTQPKETNITNCLARMEQIPKVIAAAKENLTHPPQAILETAIKQNRGTIAFYETDIFALAGQTAQLQALKKSASNLVTLLKDYQAFLEGDLMSRATGEWRLGKEKFSRQLELELDAGMTDNQVFSDAQAEFDRVRRDMYVVSRQLWSQYYPKQALPPDDAQGCLATIRLVNNAVSKEHGKPEELVQDARNAVENIKTFIRENNILHLPEPDRCQVIEMPAFRRGNSLAYLDSAAPLDPLAGSFYAISPPDWDWDTHRVETFLQEYNPFMLQILTIHEGYPGHYVQLEYAHRTPSLIRRVLQSGVYVEGWAVYTEQMMLDQGYGNRDLRLRLMQLKFYLRAVANAIIAHNMHCTDIADEDVVKFLMDDAFQSEAEARAKIVRVKQSSTQLSTYFVGRTAMYRLRQQLERELGEKFDLARYHEAVISTGSVPVKYLRELVRAQLLQSH
ncbi:MAG TPA: DUF885 domain-containing protein [Pirellulales bacterium]|jgi:uncharacterized protein (DUF885 family)|nr:DUF885 domain-containing protein [Pirellulales bacterium]